MDVVRNFLTRYEQTREEELSLEAYLELCKKNPLVYATAAERILAAIGEPEVFDTHHDQNQHDTARRLQFIGLEKPE